MGSKRHGITFTFPSHVLALDPCQNASKAQVPRMLENPIKKQPTCQTKAIFFLAWDPCQNVSKVDFFCLFGAEPVPTAGAPVFWHGNAEFGMRSPLFWHGNREFGMGENISCQFLA